jgi:hypothetical protein
MSFVFSVNLLASGKICSGALNTRRGVGLELADDALGEAEPLEEHEGLADALTLLVHVLRDEHVHELFRWDFKAILFQQLILQLRSSLLWC